MGCNVWIPLVILAAVLIIIAIVMNNGRQENFFYGHGITVNWTPPTSPPAGPNTRYQWFACNRTNDVQCGPSACTTDSTETCPVTPNNSVVINDQTYPSCPPGTTCSAQLDFGQDIAFSVRTLDISTTPPLTSGWATIVINANSPNTGSFLITSSPSSGSSTVNNPPVPTDTILNLQTTVNNNIGNLPSTVPNATVQITRGTNVWAWNASGARITTIPGNPTVYNITADTTSTLSMWTNGTASGVPGPLQAGDIITLFIISTTNTNSQTGEGDLGFYGQSTVTVTAPTPQLPSPPTGFGYTFH